MKRLVDTVRRLPQFLCVAALVVLCESQAHAICNTGGLEISEIRVGETVELHATNRLDVPVTYGLLIADHTHGDTDARSLSETLAARESRKVVEWASGGDADSTGPTVSCDWSIGSRDAAHDDDHLYLLPYADGSSFRVLQGFNSSWSHRGVEQFAIDFRMPEGTPVHAARGGIVARVEESWNTGCWRDECSRYANFIVILHDDGTTGEYYHLQQLGALVSEGDVVEAGDLIGLSGNTGRTAEPHLHFAVYLAMNGGSSQSVPVSFISADGVVYRPRNGHYYFAVGGRHAGD